MPDAPKPKPQSEQLAVIRSQEPKTSEERAKAREELAKRLAKRKRH
jgi:hypothetical protein